MTNKKKLLETIDMQMTLMRAILDHQACKINNSLKTISQQLNKMIKIAMFDGLSDPETKEELDRRPEHVEFYKDLMTTEEKGQILGKYAKMVEGLRKQFKEEDENK